MDINCTDACYYQQNGKCRLTDVSAGLAQSVGSYENGAFSGCLYFTAQINDEGIEDEDYERQRRVYQF
jgi:hypothetical protein